MLPVSSGHRPRGPAHRRPRGARRAAWEIGVLQACYLLLHAPWLVIAMGASITISDWDPVLATPVAVAVWCYPVVVYASAAAAWVLFVNGLVGVARAVNLAPLPWVLGIAAVVVWLVMN